VAKVGPLQTAPCLPSPGLLGLPRREHKKICVQTIGTLQLSAQLPETFNSNQLLCLTGKAHRMHFMLMKVMKGEDQSMGSAFTPRNVILYKHEKSVLVE
jgi:hypothetical protein